jgi:cell division protein FtsB
MLRKIFRIITNKYLVTTIAFAAWMIFFDANSLVRQHQVRDKVNQLELQKQYYKKEIVRNREAMNELMTNKATLEKYAREKFLMKRANEDVYVIVR